MSEHAPVKSTASLLREAADIIERDGYVKFIRHDEDTGACCAIGALERAATGRRSMNGSGGWAEDSCPDAMKALADMVRVKHPKVCHDSGTSSTIAEWNNKLCKSAKEVACVMRAAAKAEE